MFRNFIYLLIIGAVAWFGAGYHSMTAQWRGQIAEVVGGNSMVQGAVGWTEQTARDFAVDFLGVQFAEEDGEADDPSEMNTSEGGDGSDDVASQDSSPTPQPTSPGAGDEQTLDQYRAWIREARATHPYPDSEERMYAVMMCESEGRAEVVNSAGPYSGLFQYSAATWNGDWNTYRDENILDPRAQFFATALAWSNGMQSQWGCYNRAH